jgi:tape measure domain-containing protein
MIVGDMEIRLRADIARLQSDMDAARRVVGDATAGMAKAADMAKTALAGIAGAAGLSKIVEMSDGYSKLTAQLRLATDSTRAYNQAYADVKRIANTAQTDLSATGSLYASLSRATKDLGTSQKAVADITESVNLALKVSGAGAQESAGAILQLSQAFAAGALRGDEFNSVTEAAPRLMKAIADNIGVPVGALRAMAEQGKLTAEVVAKALPQALDQLRSEAGQIQTISGAFTVLKNNVLEFVGTQAEASGVVSVLTGGIGVLANNLQLLAGIAMTFGAAKLASSFGGWAKDTYDAVSATVASRAATIASMEATVADTGAKAAQLGVTQSMIIIAREEAAAKLAGANSNIAAARAAITAAEAAGAQSFALRTVRLATAELAVAEAQRSAMLAELAILGRQQASVSTQIAAAQTAQAAAQTALNGATSAGTAAAGLASRTLGLLGGPIGAIITVLGLAATAWSIWSRSAEASSKQAAESYQEAHKRIIKGLDEQIAKNQKLVQLQNLGMKKPEIDRNQPVLDQLAAASKRLNDINNQTGEYAPGAGKSNTDAMFDRIKAMKDIVELTEKMKKGDEVAAQASAGDTEALIAVRERLTGVNAQYLKDLEVLQAKLKGGAIGHDEYVAAVTRLAKEAYEGSTAGKQYAQSLDAQTAAIQRAAEAQGLRNQRDQEHIQFLRSSGQASEEATIRAAAASQIKDFNDQIAAQNKLLGVEAQRQQSAEQFAQKKADITGKIGALNIQIDNAKAKRDEDLFRLEQDRYRQAVGNSADVIEKEQAELASLRQQTQAQQDYNDQIGLTPKQIAEITAARLRDAAARKDIEADIAEGFDLTGERAERMRAQAAELRKQANGAVAGAIKQELLDQNLQDLNAMVDIMSALDEAAQSAAQGMANAFGSVGQAIGGMTTALTGFERTQAAIAAQLAASLKDAHGDPVKIQRANQMAAEASAQAQIKSYGDMASAAKGFFDANSKGYAVLSGVEKAYRAAEMVMALESMTKKIFFKETEVAANTTLNATKVAGEAAATSASIGLAATESSAWGITAVVKAIASMPFPLNLAAGAATLAAVVGIGAKIVGSVGGGSVSLAQQRQEAQGAGSILGDKDAKSESIKRALDQVSKNTYQDLAINSSMLATLRSIDNNISSFASQLVRTTDVNNPDIALKSGVSGANMGSVALASAGFAAGSMVTLIGSVMGPVGALAGAALSKIPAVQKLMTSIFGGKQSVEDSGFKMDAASLESILGTGAHAFQYADIKTSGGWFRSDKTSQTTKPLDDAANQQFTAIIKSLADSVKTAGDLLGLSGDEFTNKLNSFVVDIGEVSLKDLKGDDLQKAVESVFSKLGDQMAQFAVSGLGQFQKVGEGYLETLARVASEYQAIDVVFQSFGKTFGEVGVASIGARDRLVQLAGGLDQFTSQGEFFLKNFFSDQEQAAALKARIDPTLAKYGLSTEGEDASKAFRNVVIGLNTTTEAGAAAYTELMSIAPAFKAVVDAQKDALDQRKELQDQLDELTMSSTQLLAKQRDALDESNRALFDQVQALKSVKSAASTLLGGVDSAYSVLEKVVGREKAAVQLTIDAHAAAANRLQSLSQTLHSALDSMTSSQQTAANRLRAQAEIQADLAITKAGGTLSDAQVESLKKALSTVQQDATSQFSSYADYMRDLLQTQNDVAALTGLTDDSLSVEQQALAAAQDQLKSLDAILTNAQGQIDELKGQSITLLSISDALGGLTTAILGAKANPIVSATSGINQAYQQILGRAPDAAGLEYWQNVAAGGTSIDVIRDSISNSAEAQVRKLYQDILGRTADSAGLDYWLKSGASIDAIKSSFLDSDEYKKLHGIPGFASGGMFGGGLRIVGENGPELEATGPSRIWSSNQTAALLARAGSGDNAALVAEIRLLRETVAKQQAALDKIEQSTRRNADMFENATAGGNAPMLVEIA